MNDLNILDMFTLVKDFFIGKCLPDFVNNLNGKDVRLCYDCVHGIYRKWAIFRGKIPEAVSSMERHLSSTLSGFRKDFEIDFGV